MCGEVYGRDVCEVRLIWKSLDVVEHLLVVGSAQSGDRVPSDSGTVTVLAAATERAVVVPFGHIVERRGMLFIHFVEQRIQETELRLVVIKSVVV